MCLSTVQQMLETMHSVCTACEILSRAAECRFFTETVQFMGKTLISSGARVFAARDKRLSVAPNQISN